MTRSENTPDTPHYWDTMREVRYLPATPALVADLRGRRSTHDAPPAVDLADGTRQVAVSRCTMCGQWTWAGVCTLHPEARQDTY